MNEHGLSTLDWVLIVALAGAGIAIALIVLNNKNEQETDPAAQDVPEATTTTNAASANKRDAVLAELRSPSETATSETHTGELTNIQYECVIAYAEFKAAYAAVAGGSLALVVAQDEISQEEWDKYWDKYSEPEHLITLEARREAGLYRYWSNLQDNSIESGWRDLLHDLSNLINDAKKLISESKTPDLPDVDWDYELEIAQELLLQLETRLDQLEIRRFGVDVNERRWKYWYNEQSFTPEERAYGHELCERWNIATGEQQLRTASTQR